MALWSILPVEAESILNKIKHLVGKLGSERLLKIMNLPTFKNVFSTDVEALKVTHLALGYSFSSERNYSTAFDFFYLSEEFNQAHRVFI